MLGASSSSESASVLRIVWLVLVASVIADAVAANPSDSELRREITRIEVLSDTNLVAALAEVRRLQALPEYQAVPNQLAELRAAECLLTLNDQPKDAIPLAEQALKTADLPAQARVPLQVCLGSALEWTGQLEAARGHYEAAVVEARRAGLPLLLADSLGSLAALEYYQGSLVVAAGRLREAQALIEKALADLPTDVQANPDDPAQIAVVRSRRSVLQKLGQLYIGMDDSEKAMSYFQPLLDEAIALNMTQSQIIGYYNIGRALEESGKLAEAWTAQYQSLKLAQAAADEASVAWSQRSLGAILVLQERYQEAAPYIEPALAAFEAMADAEIIAQLKFYRARIHRHRGNIAAAEADLRAAIGTFRQNQTWRFLDKALVDLAQLRQQAGALPEALQLRDERDDIHRKLDRQIQDRAAARLQAEFDNQAQLQENRRLAELQTWQANQLRDAEKLARQQYLIIALAAIIAIFVAYFAVRQLRIAHQMRTIALTDELTKVPNRRAIYALAESQWQLGTEPLSLLILDIDFFKRINDKFGHSTGDEALKLVAQCCRDQLRHGDAIGRVGGEEFMVVLPGASAGVAGSVAERLRQAVLRAPASQIAAELSLSISIGVATRSAGDGQLQGFINRADTALYRAKAGGRNRVENDATGAAAAADADNAVAPVAVS